MGKGGGGKGKGKVILTTYTYQIKTAMAISFGPLSEFFRLDFNSDYKYYNAGNSGTLALNTSDNILMGNIYYGNDGQSPSPNLSKMHEGLSYNHIAYADFWLDLGEAPSMPNTAFTVTRYYVPTLPGGSWGSTTGSCSGMNPAIVLYDILTNPHYGYGLSTDLLHSDSFSGASNQLAAEDLTVSTCIATMELYAIVRAILDWVDGELVYREDTGQIGLRLRRKDYTLDQLVQVHADDMRAQTFELQRPSWYGTKNVIYVNFLDITRECDQNLVYSEDVGNFNLTGNQRVHEFNFDVFTESSMAQKVATRLLHRHTYPWAKVSFECFSSKGDTLRVFEPFWLQHSYYGVDAVFRVTEKRRQGPNIWKIEAVEENFCVNAAFAAGYDEPYPTPPYVDPLAISSWSYRVLNSYYRGYLILGYSDDQTTNVILDCFAVTSGAASAMSYYACIGRLTTPITSGHLANIYVDKDKHFQDDFSTIGYILIGDEIMKIDSASETEDQVYYTSGLTSRGLESTVQDSYSIGEKVFAVDCRAFVADNMLQDEEYTMEIFPHYMFPTPEFDSDDSITYSIIWNSLIDMPMNPFDLDGDSYDPAADITFTWDWNSRQRPIPTPCSGLSAYPQTDTGNGWVDQILGWRVCHYELEGTSALITTYLTPDARSFASTYGSRAGVGLYTGFKLNVYARGVKGFDSLPATIDI
jgi:hypothetical protein